MKRMLFSAALFFAGNTVFAQCPTIKLNTGGYEFKEGEPLTITVNTDAENVTYNWSVSAGTISSGQGTSAITVESKGLAGQTVTATIELGGMSPSCSSSGSATVAITAAPIPVKAKKTKTKAKMPVTKVKSKPVVKHK